MSDSIKALRDAIDDRFVAVFRDLPQGNGLMNRAKMATREVANNAKEMIGEVPA